MEEIKNGFEQLKSCVLYFLEASNEGEEMVTLFLFAESRSKKPTRLRERILAQHLPTDCGRCAYIEEADRDREKIGWNASTQPWLEVLLTLRHAVQTVPYDEYHAMFKRIINKATKHVFDKVKMRGIKTFRKNKLIVSRGYPKLADVLAQMRNKPKGRILSLACGAGGWEQLLCTEYSGVETIGSVTLGPKGGHLGHKQFSTIPWMNKHKVTLR